MKMNDMKDLYHGNIYFELDPVEADCAVSYCRKPIKPGDEYFEHQRSDDLLCSMRCVELHFADWSEPPPRDELEL